MGNQKDNSGKDKAMKKDQVQIGRVYVVKVSGKPAPVKIIGHCPYGGWYGQNVKTGRQVRIRTAARLRREVTADRPFGRPLDGIRRRLACGVLRPADCGGAFDGVRVSSDADPGL